MITLQIESVCFLCITKKIVQKNIPHFPNILHIICDACKAEIIVTKEQIPDIQKRSYFFASPTPVFTFAVRLDII